MRIRPSTSTWMRTNRGVKMGARSVSAIHRNVCPNYASQFLSPQNPASGGYFSIDVALAEALEGGGGGVTVDLIKQ